MRMTIECERAWETYKNDTAAGLLHKAAFVAGWNAAQDNAGDVYCTECGKDTEDNWYRVESGDHALMCAECYHKKFPEGEG